MKFPLAIKAFGPELTATKPFAATAAALSNLDPAPYSLPEPPAPRASGGKANSLQPTAASASAAAVAVTFLPGSAARPSMDVSTPDSKPRRTTADRSSLYACQAADLATCRDVDAVQDAQPAAALLRQQQQQHLKAQPPSSPPPPAAARRASLHYDRDANRARRNYRPSIDAAAGAMMLYTSPAAEPQSPPATVSETGPRLAPVYDMPGCVPPPPPAPFAEVRGGRPPRPPPGAATAPANEWCFGDNLQRARMLARYAAMVAADEMRYEPSPGGAAGNDSDDDGSGEASRRSRGAWKLLSSLLSSTRGGKAASSAATASIVQRWQEAAAPAGGRRCGGPAGGGSGGSRRSVADDDTPVVVRSRDSRRLLRVHRSRVGIDGEGQKQRAPGRASAPAFTQQQQQQQQPKLTARQLQSRNSAPAMLNWDGEEEEDDAVTAAVIAAAAEFAATERPP